MQRNQYRLIINTISQTIHYLDHHHHLSQDDRDEIKNQTLLKLTPQLKKILLFEPLHRQNFVRKTTRSVFWDYLKDMSIDLTQYRLKKRIKSILVGMDEANCRFIKPDNDSPWFKEEKYLNHEISPEEKQKELEILMRRWQSLSVESEKNTFNDTKLIELITFIFHQVDFGISVNEIYSTLASITNIEVLTKASLDAESSDGNGGNFSLLGIIPVDHIPAKDFRIEELSFYQTYAEEFLNTRVSTEQSRIYYFRFAANLSFKEIQENYGINIKTAESRLSLKPNKKGFLWRLVQYVRQLELSMEECQKFFFILNRKIEESFSNTK